MSERKAQQAPASPEASNGEPSCASFRLLGALPTRAVPGLQLRPSTSAARSPGPFVMHLHTDFTHGAQPLGVGPVLTPCHLI